MALKIEYMRMDDNRFRGIVWDGSEIKEIAEAAELKLVVSVLSSAFPGVPNNTGFKTATAILKRI